MAITPPTYTPSGNLFGTSTTTTTPYTYGNLGNNTSAYNIWGSKGNPYLIAGPTYTPGSGAPIAPQPVAPVTYPINNGGDSSPIPDWVDPNSAESQAQSYGDLQSWLDRDRTMTRGISSLLGAPLFDPAVDLMYGINPYTQQSYSWYDGSTDDFGYVGSDATLSGQDLSAAVASYDLDFQAGMTDLGQDEYIAQYMADRTKDDPNNPAQRAPAWYNNIWGGTPTTPAVNAPKTFGNPNSALAQEARAGIASEKTRVATNIAINSAKAEQAAIAAENPAQAARDALYVGTASDGYAATANRYGTTPGSEQTAMLAEQDMGMSAPATVAEAVAEGKPFGKEGDDSWSPNGKDVYHGPGHNWNTPDSENKAPPGKVTPPPSSNDGGSSDEAGSASNSNMADAGFSQEDQDFIDSGFDEEDSGGGDSGGGGGGSYIATAATQSLGEEGLSVFNNWRDYMHSWHPTFTTSFGRYRVTAPKIVKAIDAKDNSKELYKEIWDEYLLPIHKLITDKDDTNALIKYKVMVKELMNKYLKGDK